MRNAELVGGSVFESGYRLTEDKLLRLQHMPEGLKQLMVQGLVLTLQVEHGNRLAFGSGMHGRVGTVLHPDRVAAGHKKSSTSDGSSQIPVAARHYERRTELKRLVNLAIVDSLRDQAEPGLPAPRPWICFFTKVQDGCTQHPNPGKQEIGTWKTSRHRTFRTPS